MDEQLKLSALAYHQFPKPGKISVTPFATRSQKALLLWALFLFR